jgi:UPF0176 protein
MSEQMNTHEIILYYNYAKIADPIGFMNWHKAVCQNLGLTGRVLIATEGINGTLEGTKEHIEEYCRLFLLQDGSEGTFGNLSTTKFKRSRGTGHAFPRLSIKVRDEVVSLSLDKNDDIDPNQITGKHLKPEELKQWYDKGEDFVVIDMRNDYEFKVGHFKDSINPKLDNFRDLPKIMPQLEPIKELSKQGKKVLTVCTGGIRCEKASGFLVKHGFENVHQLDGGMHNYMEKFPGEDFLGALYVFDGRETVEFATEKGLPRVIVGKCDLCEAPTEMYANCANDECHKKMLCCIVCKQKEAELSGVDLKMSSEDQTKDHFIKRFIYCSEACRVHGPTVHATKKEKINV